MISIFVRFSTFLPLIPWGADLPYIPFSQSSPVKREPVALSVQRHAGNKNLSPYATERVHYSVFSLLRKERNTRNTSNWDSAVHKYTTLLNNPFRFSTTIICFC